MNKNKSCCAGEEVTTLPVTPKQARDHSGDAETENQEEGKIPAVLPPHDFVLAQIADVSNTRFTSRLDEHPTDVGVPESLVGIVWIQVSVGVPVVCAVAPGPPLDRALNSASASHCQSILERLRGVVCPVSP